MTALGANRSRGINASSILGLVLNVEGKAFNNWRHVSNNILQTTLTNHDLLHVTEVIIEQIGFAFSKLQVRVELAKLHLTVSGVLQANEAVTGGQVEVSFICRRCWCRSGA